MSKPSYRGAPLHIYIPGVLGLACRVPLRGHTDFHPHLARLRTATCGLPATCKPHPCLHIPVSQLLNTHATVGGTKNICAILWLSFINTLFNERIFAKLAWRCSVSSPQVRTLVHNLSLLAVGTNKDTFN